MTIHPIWRRAAANVAALGLAAVLLSACMITSPTNLVPESEAATPLPDSFTMTSYTMADGATDYTKAEDGTSAFTRSGSSYGDAEASMKVFFVPLEANTYLLDIAATDGTMYGVAKLDGGIMEIRMVLTTDPATDLTSPPAGVTIADGGIVVADRAALDVVIGLVRDGTLKTGPLVSWVGSDPAPAKLVPEGDWYRAE